MSFHSSYISLWKLFSAAKNPKEFQKFFFLVCFHIYTHFLPFSIVLQLEQKSFGSTFQQQSRNVIESVRVLQFIRASKQVFYICHVHSHPYGSKIVATISTLVAALFAIYSFQVSAPTSAGSVTAFEFGEEGEFCEISGGDSKCSESTMGDEGKSASEAAAASSIYDLSYTSIDGTEESMEKYRGHVLIVVNVASKCGYTCVNYEQLTELYDKYAESKGLRILAFPCNQFMGQEPLGEKEIKEFAATYNVRYDMASKVDVNGANTHPVWAFLKKHQGGFMGDFVKWNFTKFLVNKYGEVVKRYSPTTNPRELEKDLLTYFSDE